MPLLIMRAASIAVASPRRQGSVAKSPPKQRRTKMPRRLITSGSTFEKSIGYSRAVVDGDWIFVSGTTGFDYSNMTIEDDAVAQCEQALKNIEAALAQAGSGFPAGV